ncbi:MAG: hypothetical protein II564_06140 [Oscillospiraceae bacterium]|nr:hypothetical protein [Oscillospiraceae bacterium]
MENNGKRLQRTDLFGKKKKWGIIASFNNVIYKEKPHTGEIHEGRKTDRADLEKKDPQNGEKRTGGHLQYQ